MFTHLHVHTENSMLDGLSRIDQMIAKAKELGIINKVVEQNSLKTQTKDIIEKILESPPIALKYMKKNMKKKQMLPLD